MHQDAEPSGSSTSAITVLERHHRQISMLLAELAKLGRPSKARGDLCRATAGALTAHVILRERHVRPAIAAKQPAGLHCGATDGRLDLDLESVLADLARLGASRFPCVALLSAVRERVEAYLAEEERVLLRTLSSALSGSELVTLGATMLSTMEEIEWGFSPGAFSEATQDRAPVSTVRRAATLRASRRRPSEVILAFRMRRPTLAMSA